MTTILAQVAGSLATASWRSAYPMAMRKATLSPERSPGRVIIRVGGKLERVVSVSAYRSLPLGHTQQPLATVRSGACGRLLRRCCVARRRAIQLSHICALH